MSNEAVLATIRTKTSSMSECSLFTDLRGKLQHVTVMADQVDADFP